MGAAGAGLGLGAGGGDATGNAGPQGQGQADAGGLFYQPRPIPMPASLAMERIKMIACSSRHSLVLTALGNIFVCGENSEGALGTGDLKRRSNLVLLSWPPDPNLPSQPPPRVAKVAAGSGSIGSHSLAIDSDGQLYGWGVPYAAGHGGLRPHLSPTLLTSFPLDAMDSGAPELAAADAGGPVEAQGRGPLDEEDESYIGSRRRSPTVRDVACGGGFSVCVLESGTVYSWGSWLFGKLGLGPTPTISSAHIRGRGGRKLARFQLTPVRVQGLRSVESVSCGEVRVGVGVGVGVGVVKIIAGTFLQTRVFKLFLLSPSSFLPQTSPGTCPLRDDVR